MLAGLPLLDREPEADRDLLLLSEEDLDLLLSDDLDLDLRQEIEVKHQLLVWSYLLESESESTPFAFCNLFPFLVSTSLSSSSLE